MLLFSSLLPLSCPVGEYILRKHIWKAGISLKMATNLRFLIFLSTFIFLFILILPEKQKALHGKVLQEKRSFAIRAGKTWSHLDAQHECSLYLNFRIENILLYIMCPVLDNSEFAY